MIKQLSQDVLFDYEDAIINDEFEGFKEDYLCLHSLIRRYRPASFFEIGTNMGVGTNIICNAMILSKEQTRKLGRDCYIYSLDLPTELAHVSLQHPISEGKGDKVGSLCKFPFTQLRGDSLHFVYEDYPCEGYFVDGEHDFEHVLHETKSILKCNPKLVVFHDTDILGVLNGILNAIDGKPYEIYRVTDTRISYLLPK